MNAEWLLNGEGKMLLDRANSQDMLVKDINVSDYVSEVNIVSNQLQQLQEVMEHIKNLKENMEYFKQSDKEKTEQIENLLQIINKMTEKD